MNKIISTAMSILLLNNIYAMDIQKCTSAYYDEKKWESDLKNAIITQNFAELEKLLQDQSLCQNYPDALNRSFIEASWRNTEGINIKMMEQFLNTGKVDVNYVNKNFFVGNALLSVALRRHTKAVQLLLNQPGIKVNTKISLKKETKTILEWMKDIKIDETFEFKNIINLLVMAAKKEETDSK